jgi:hypothetical protein
VPVGIPEDGKDHRHRDQKARNAGQLLAHMDVDQGVIQYATLGLWDFGRSVDPHPASPSPLGVVPRRPFRIPRAFSPSKVRRYGAQTYCTT